MIKTTNPMIYTSKTVHPQSVANPQNCLFLRIQVVLEYINDGSENQTVH